MGPFAAAVPHGVAVPAAPASFSALACVAAAAAAVAKRKPRRGRDLPANLPAAAAPCGTGESPAAAASAPSEGRVAAAVDAAAAAATPQALQPSSPPSAAAVGAIAAAGGKTEGGGWKGEEAEGVGEVFPAAEAGGARSSAADTGDRSVLFLGAPAAVPGAAAASQGGEAEAGGAIDAVIRFSPAGSAAVDAPAVAGEAAVAGARAAVAEGAAAAAAAAPRDALAAVERAPAAAPAKSPAGAAAAAGRPPADACSKRQQQPQRLMEGKQNQQLQLQRRQQPTLQAPLWTQSEQQQRQDAEQQQQQEQRQTQQQPQHIPREVRRRGIASRGAFAAEFLHETRRMSSPLQSAPFAVPTAAAATVGAAAAGGVMAACGAAAACSAADCWPGSGFCLSRAAAAILRGNAASDRLQLRGAGRTAAPGGAPRQEETAAAAAGGAERHSGPTAAAAGDSAAAAGKGEGGATGGGRAAATSRGGTAAEGSTAATDRGRPAATAAWKVFQRGGELSRASAAPHAAAGKDRGARGVWLLLLLFVTCFGQLLCSPQQQQQHGWVLGVAGVRFEGEAGSNDWLIVNVGPVTHLHYASAASAAAGSAAPAADRRGRAAAEDAAAAGEDAVLAADAEETAAAEGRQQLSTATAAALHAEGSQDLEEDVLLVGTSSGAVAAVAAATGELRWRRLHREGDAVSRLQRVGSNYLMAARVSLAAETPDSGNALQLHLSQWRTSGLHQGAQRQQDAQQQQQYGEQQQQDEPRLQLLERQLNLQAEQQQRPSDLSLHVYEQSSGALLWSVEREKGLLDYVVVSAGAAAAAAEGPAAAAVGEGGAAAAERGRDGEGAAAARKGATGALAGSVFASGKGAHAEEDQGEAEGGQGGGGEAASSVLLLLYRNGYVEARDVSTGERLWKRLFFPATRGLSPSFSAAAAASSDAESQLQLQQKQQLLTGEGVLLGFLGSWARPRGKAALSHTPHTAAAATEGPQVAAAAGAPAATTRHGGALGSGEASAGGAADVAEGRREPATATGAAAGAAAEGDVVVGVLYYGRLRENGAIGLHVVELRLGDERKGLAAAAAAAPSRTAAAGAGYRVAAATLLLQGKTEQEQEEQQQQQQGQEKQARAAAAAGGGEAPDSEIYVEKILPRALPSACAAVVMRRAEKEDVAEIRAITSYELLARRQPPAAAAAEEEEEERGGSTSEGRPGQAAPRSAPSRPPPGSLPATAAGEDGEGSPSFLSPSAAGESGKVGRSSLLLSAPLRLRSNPETEAHVMPTRGCVLAVHSGSSEGSAPAAARAQQQRRFQQQQEQQQQGPGATPGGDVAAASSISVEGDAPTTTTLYRLECTAAAADTCAFRKLLVLGGRWAAGALAQKYEAAAGAHDTAALQRFWRTAAAPAAATAAVLFSAATTAELQQQQNNLLTPPPINTTALIMTRINNDAVEALLVDTRTGRAVSFASARLELQKRLGQKSPLLVLPDASASSFSSSSNAATLSVEAVVGLLPSRAAAGSRAAEGRNEEEALGRIRRRAAGGRLFLSLDDGTFAFVDGNGRWLWTREEALADISGVVMLTLPYTAAHSSYEGEACSKRWLPQFFGQLSRNVGEKMRELRFFERALVQPEPAPGRGEGGREKGGEAATAGVGWLAAVRQQVLRSSFSLLFGGASFVEQALDGLQRISCSAEVLLRQFFEFMKAERRRSSLPPSSALASRTAAPQAHQLHTGEKEERSRRPLAHASLSARRKLRLLGFALPSGGAGAAGPGGGGGAEENEDEEGNGGGQEDDERETKRQAGKRKHKKRRHRQRAQEQQRVVRQRSFAAWHDQAEEEDTAGTAATEAFASRIDPRLFGWTDLILAATCHGHVYALHAATGVLLWQQRLAGGGCSSRRAGGGWSSSSSSRAARAAAARRCKIAALVDGAGEGTSLAAAAATNGRTTLVRHFSPGGLSFASGPPQLQQRAEEGRGTATAAEAGETSSKKRQEELSVGVLGLQLVGPQKKELLVAVPQPECNETQLFWIDAALGLPLHVATAPFIASHVIPLQSVHLYHHHRSAGEAAEAAEEKKKEETEEKEIEDELASYIEQSNAVVLVHAQTDELFFFLPDRRNHKTQQQQPGRLPLLDRVDCDLAEYLSRRLTLYKIAYAEQELRGYFLRPSSSSRAGEGEGSDESCSVRLQQAWNFDLSHGGTHALVVAARPLHSNYPHVPVLTTTKITLLHKYINPNLIAIISQDVGEAAAKTQEGTVEKLLLLTLINLVDGSVVYTNPLPSGASLPLHAVVYDNVVVVHYWNVFHTRFELHVVELYDAQKDEGPWSIILSAMLHIVPSDTGFEMPVPASLAETYVLPSGVRTLGVSATRQGITTRALLLGTGHGQQIFALSTQYANARRPRLSPHSPPQQQQQQQIEDGLLPYHPVLSLSPQDCLSYSQQVFFVRGIAAHPTSRESTSSIFSFGVDLFFSPVQPAKGFDVLNPHFNYGLLGGAMALLFGLVLFTRWRAKEEDLAAKWT